MTALTIALFGTFLNGSLTPALTCALHNSSLKFQMSIELHPSNLDEDVVHEWLSSNGLSQHYAVYSENHITTLFQG